MRFCAAEMVVDIETDETEEKVSRLMQLAEDQCPVGNLFADAGYEPALTFNILPRRRRIEFIPVGTGLKPGNIS